MAGADGLTGIPICCRTFEGQTDRQSYCRVTWSRYGLGNCFSDTMSRIEKRKARGFCSGFTRPQPRPRGAISRKRYAVLRTCPAWWRLFWFLRAGIIDRI